MQLSTLSLHLVFGLLFLLTFSSLFHVEGNEKWLQMERKLFFDRKNEKFEGTYRRVMHPDFYPNEVSGNNMGSLITSQPIIAILTQPADRDMHRPNQSVIHSEYVRWVEQSGARAIVLPHDASDNFVEHILPHVSGIIFQGGETELIDRDCKYLQTSIRLLNYAWEYNVPVFGICLGFELFMVWASGNPKIILDIFDSENVTMPLIFERDTRESKLFSNLDENLATILTTLPVTINLHHNGITRETFEKAGLNRYFRIVAHNYDLSGKNFISIVESHHKPMYGVQFHPERNAYIGNPLYATNRSPAALITQRYFSDFFIAEARKYFDGGSVPCCSSPLEKYLLHRHQPTWINQPDYMKNVYLYDPSFFEF